MLKIDLQDAYFHVLIHPNSRKYLHFAFENKVYQFRVLPFSLNTALRYLLAWDTQWQLTSIVKGYIGNSICRRLVDTSPRPANVTSPSVSVTNHTRHGRPQVKRSKIQTRTSSGYPVSGASITFGSRESFPASIQGSGDNGTDNLIILPENIVVYRIVPIHGITQLALRSHAVESSTLEALAFSFIRSDKPVFTNMSFRPFSPCHPTQALAGPIVSHIRISLSDLSRWNTQGCCAHMEDSRIAGVWTPFRTPAPHQRTGAHVSDIGTPSLGCSITGPDNTTVVAYINKQGWTHSHPVLRLVVDLFLWLHAQDITLRARHIPGCLNVVADRLSRLE